MTFLRPNSFMDIRLVQLKIDVTTKSSINVFEKVLKRVKHCVMINTVNTID